LEVQSVRPLAGKLGEQDAAGIRLHGQDVAFDRMDALDCFLALTLSESPRKAAIFVETHGILRSTACSRGPVANDAVRRNSLGSGRRLFSWLVGGLGIARRKRSQ